MGILTWVVLGAVAAWLERQLLPKGPRSSFVGSMILAFAGAILGSLVAYAMGYGEITGFNARSITISAVGVVVILAGYRVVLRLMSKSDSKPPDATHRAAD